jgi:hypothetical protein
MRNKFFALILKIEQFFCRHQKHTVIFGLAGTLTYLNGDKEHITSRNRCGNCWKELEDA